VKGYGTARRVAGSVLVRRSKSGVIRNKRRKPPVCRFVALFYPWGIISPCFLSSKIRKLGASCQRVETCYNTIIKNSIYR
ncbi:MAG: hypothetical protein IKS45_06055, partial [Thermoguttaceae bacterium]|nr:hypothetical protein [Thermoguttaceae bacterium]